MKTQFRYAEARDFNQRYVGTYGYLEREGKDDLPVFIRDLEGDTLIFEDLNGNNFHTYADKGVGFRFQQIRRQVYVGASGDVYVIARHPARQYQRGVCANNTHIYKYVKGAGFRAARVNHENMRDVMYSTPNAEMAPNRYKLSDVFTLLDGTLYMYQFAIGAKTDTGVQLMRGYELFTQEVNDSLRDSGLNLKVVYA